MEVERTRWLHRRSELGYTNDPGQALPREPPALSADDYERLVYLARRRDADRGRAAAVDRRLLSFERRLRDVRAQAKARRVDVSSELSWLRLAFEQQRKPGTVMRRLERVEDRVFALPPDDQEYLSVQPFPEPRADTGP